MSTDVNLTRNSDMVGDICTEEISPALPAVLGNETIEPEVTRETVATDNPGRLSELMPEGMTMRSVEEVDISSEILSLELSTWVVVGGASVKEGNG